MELNEKALANAVAVLGGGGYLLCVILFMVAPESLMFVFNSWFHGVDLDKLSPQNGDWVLGTGNIWFGFPSFVGVSWVSGWLLARLYNQFAK